MTGEQIRSILGATILAILVWVYAEAESLRTLEPGIELAFEAAPASDRVIDVFDPAGGANAQLLPPGSTIRVTVSLEGSTSSLDAIARRGQGRTITFRPGDPGIPDKPGEYPLSLRDILREASDFRDHGIAVKKVEPESLRITIDETTSREVKVSVVTPGGDLDGLPESQPRVAKVFAPAREARSLTDASTATVRVDEATWARLVPGRRETIAGVPLELPKELAGSARARMEPSLADVIVTVRSRTNSILIPSVPVHLRIAPAELAKFDVDIAEPDRSLIDVTVSGPADLVRQIEDRSIPLIAFVPLSFEELERGIPSKDAQFSSVPGGALKFEAANRSVRLKIKRREPAPTGPTTPP
ncbi:hypothetical protein PHYC_00263 [Phycisphaerales bacterium]|nr:hypothetical protein PHYC_00263 [Phycisphaerales bacterium]